MISEDSLLTMRFGLLVPQRRHRDLAGVVRLARRIGLVEIVKAVDRIRRAFGKIGALLERPAVIARMGNRGGDADRAVELLDREVMQRAMRPRAVVRDIEMIAPGLGLVAGRAVGRDAVAEDAFGAVEFAGLAGFRRKLLVAPFAVDQNAHDQFLSLVSEALEFLGLAVTSGSGKKHSSTSGSVPVLRVMCFSFGGISTMSPGLIGISPLSAMRHAGALAARRCIPRSRRAGAGRAACRPASARRDFGDAERDARADLARHRLERRAARQTQALRFRLLQQPRHHFTCRNALDLARCRPAPRRAARKISARLPGDRVGDVGEHLVAFLGGRVLRAAEPAGRRDRADVGQHRLDSCACGAACPSCGRGVVGRIVDAVEMHEVGPMRQHRQRLDLAAVGEAVAGMAVKLLGDVAGLHGEHASCRGRDAAPRRRSRARGCCPRAS